MVLAYDDSQPVIKVLADGTHSYSYVEECDCGVLESELFTKDTAAGDYHAWNQKDEDGVLICRDATGKYFPNSNSGGGKNVTCRSNCTISRCGDGILDEANGEKCDDGNNDDHDDCTNNCQLKSRCGDGIYSFKRSYLCEEVLVDSAASADVATAWMKKMRDRGVVDCCNEGDSECISKGDYLCSTLASSLRKSAEQPYGPVYNGKDSSLQYWFEKKKLHCCYNPKYEGGDDNGNCLNPEHITEYINDLQKYVKSNCQNNQENLVVDPWENCETAGYSERCEKCDPNGFSVEAPGHYCGCHKLTGANYTACVEKCAKDPCGCLAYCEYKNSNNSDVLACKGRDDEIQCIKKVLASCITKCEARNAYCQDDLSQNSACWNITGSCGDGIVSGNEKCDNLPLDATGASYTDLDGRTVNVPQDKLTPGRGGIYCTGDWKGTGTGDTKFGLCDPDDDNPNNCWLKGCSEYVHGGNEGSYCGDGRTDTFAGENCDSGDNYNGSYGYCNKACSAKLPYCGDNVVTNTGEDQRGVPYDEQCDDGPNNGKYKPDNKGYCNTGCHNGWGEGGYCGDGVIQKSSDNDCTCTGSGDERVCKNADGLTCIPGVEGASEACDTADQRTLDLKNAGITNVTGICNNCSRVGSCGDGTRDLRFEGCDCGNGTEGCTQTGTDDNGEPVYDCSSRTCSATYGSETVNFKCFAGCKANAIGKVNSYSNVEISGWACDPDYPMDTTADIVKIVFTGRNTGSYSGSNAQSKSVDVAATLDSTNDVIKACGGGTKHNWKYTIQSTGISLDNQPISVKVYAYSIDKIENSESPEDAEAEIGSFSITMGQECGDGIVTKCANIPVTLTKGTIANGKICYNAANAASCTDLTKCFVVSGECSSYGLENGQACVDEKCDEGINNGPTGRCSNGTGTSARKCDYNYCGDGAVQKPNGKAKENSVGYNDPNYSTTSPKAFNEECDTGSSPKLCTELFTVQCTDSTETTPANCIPIGAKVDKDVNTSCNTGTCMWKRDADCKITTKCPSLSTVFNGWKTGNSWDGGDAIFYARSASTTSQTYQRQWSVTDWNTGAGEWSDSAVTELTHYANGLEGPAQACAFECYNNTNSGTAKLVWSGNKCVPQDGTLTCNPCSDPNGGYKKNGSWQPCNEDNWKIITQTIEIKATGKVEKTPPEVDTPAYSATFNASDCSYQCKEGSSAVQKTKKCLENVKTTQCTGLPTHAVWATVSKSDGHYLVAKATNNSLAITQRLDTNTGNYFPDSTPIAAIEGLIADEEANQNPLNGGYQNRCYYKCEQGYIFSSNGVCQKLEDECGNGKIRTMKCRRTGYPDTIPDDGEVGEFTHTITVNGKTYSKTVPCYYDSDAENQEVCDDGQQLNGKYVAAGFEYTASDDTTFKRSACKNDCSGYIQDYKFFCGDGIVQYTSTEGYSSDKGCGSNGATCEKITGNAAGQYPGPGWSESVSDFTGEKCDPNDTKNNTDTQQITNKLCNLAKGTNVSNYTARSEITCSSNCTINNTDRCAICGNGTTEYGENCGEGSDKNIYSVGSAAKDRCAAAFTVENNSTYTINIPGVYCFTVKGGDGNIAPWNSGYGCSGATVKGCYTLQKGDKLTFKVGSVGASAEADTSSVCSGNYGGGGGGGASWVYHTRGTTNKLLLVAGGGGGSGWNNGSCGVGSGTTSATAAGVTGSNDCSDNWNSDGTAVTESNFTSTTGAGGDGGYYYTTTTKCGDKVCDSRYSCGGGGGGYSAGGTKGGRDGGGGGGGSYVNTTNYYNSGSSLTAGSTGITSPANGSITVQKPTSNATCSSSCQWSTSYTSCN